MEKRLEGCEARCQIWSGEYLGGRPSTSIHRQIPPDSAIHQALELIVDSKCRSRLEVVVLVRSVGVWRRWIEWWMAWW